LDPLEVKCKCFCRSCLYKIHWSPISGIFLWNNLFPFWRTCAVLEGKMMDNQLLSDLFERPKWTKKHLMGVYGLYCCWKHKTKPNVII
jgi:hypothetical protein